MSATDNSTTTPKKQCLTCDKSGGVMICDGCQQAFCGKHVLEHRQKLGEELDRIMIQYDLIQEEIHQPSSKKSSLLETIDEWEKEAIAKIQQAAAAARNRLEVLENESRQQLSKKFGDLSTVLRTSREADDFSEVELRDWLNRLKELQSESSTPSTVKVVYSKKLMIRLIGIEENKPELIPPASTQQKPTENPTPDSTKAKTETSMTDDLKKTETAKSSTIPNKSASVKSPTPSPKFSEKFLELMGPAATSEESLVFTHTGISQNDAYARGALAYSGGCHTIRFQIVQCKKHYCIFFGCMSSKEKLKADAFKCPQSVGWFGSSQVYEHERCSSNCAKYGYNSAKFQEGDVMHLIFDCGQQQIRLFNERLKQSCHLKVKINLTPFPWQFLVVLRYSGDSVRILPNVS